MRIDFKYKGEVFKNDGTPVPEEEWIVFRAGDKFVPDMLEHYIDCCLLDPEVDGYHVHTVRELRDRVLKFQETKIKVPDTKNGDMFEPEEKGGDEDAV